MIRGVASFQDEAEVAEEPAISFKKIKLNYKVFARFAIQGQPVILQNR